MRLLLLACLLLLGACKGTREDPPLFIYDSHSLATLSASLHVRDVKGALYNVADTHSMEPLLMGGDLIVTVPVEFDAIRVGQVIVYTAQWTPKGAPPVVHRVVLKDHLGLVLSGDNNKRSESGYRVTRDQVLGLVAGIYRVKLP